MSYIILARNPSNGRVIAIEHGDGENTSIALFETEDEAESAAHNAPVCRVWPYAVVEAP